MSGKRSKLQPTNKATRAQKAAPATLEDLGARATRTLETELDHQDRVRAGLARALQSEGTNPALIRESNGVSRAIVGISAELRAIEKHSRNIVNAMTDEERDQTIFAYAETMPRSRRDAIRRLWDEMDADESLVGSYENVLGS